MMKNLILSGALAAVAEASYYTYARAEQFLEFSRIVTTCDRDTYNYAGNSLTAGFVLNTKVNSGMVGYLSADNAIWVAFGPITDDEYTQITYENSREESKLVPYDAWPACDCTVNQSNYDHGQAVYTETKAAIDTLIAANSGYTDINLTGYSWGASTAF